MFMGPPGETAGPVPGAPDEVRGLGYLEEALERRTAVVDQLGLRR